MQALRFHVLAHSTKAATLKNDATRRHQRINESGREDEIRARYVRETRIVQVCVSG